MFDFLFSRPQNQHSVLVVVGQKKIYFFFFPETLFPHSEFTDIEVYSHRDYYITPWGFVWYWQIIPFLISLVVF